MKRSLPLYALLWALLLLPLVSKAQPKPNQKFAAAGYLGLNLGQIDGDYYFGYNRPGVRFGIETHYLWRPKSFFTIGIGFTQEGAQPTRREINQRGGNAVDLRLNMVEIPLLYNLRLGRKSDRGKKDAYALYRSLTVQAGLKLTRLTSYRVAETGTVARLPRDRNFTSVEAEFQDFDLAAVVGVTVPAGLRAAFFVQHTKSILGLYRPKVKMRNSVLPLFNYSLTLGGKVMLY